MVYYSVGHSKKKKGFFAGLTAPMKWKHVKGKEQAQKLANQLRKNKTTSKVIVQKNRPGYNPNKYE